MTAVDKPTTVEERTDVRGKLRDIANRVVEILENKGYEAGYTLDYDNNILYIDIYNVEETREALEDTIKILTSKETYDKLKDIKLIYRDIYVKLYGKKYYDIDIKVTFVNGTISIDYYTIIAKVRWDTATFWEYLSSYYETYFNKSEWNRLEKFLEIDEGYFIDLYEKAYQKLKEKAEECVKEKLIEGWTDESDTWDIGIELRIWKTTRKTEDVEEVMNDLERYGEGLIETFEEELIRLLQETVKKFKTIKEFNEWYNKEKLKKYAEFLDKAKEILVVYTRDVYNKSLKANIKAFKILLHINDANGDYIMDLAYNMKMDKVKFDYLAKNHNDFVVSVVGTDRILEVLYKIALAVYDSKEALKKANKWLYKVKIYD